MGRNSQGRRATNITNLRRFDDIDGPRPARTTLNQLKIMVIAACGPGRGALPQGRISALGPGRFRARANAGNAGLFKRF